MTATILVVDDEPGMLAGIRLLLEMEGYQVLVASGGASALEVLEQHIPDLILADIVMDELDGYQFYARLRDDPRWIDTPFVFITARTDPADVRLGKKLGVDDYLTKPFEPADLLAIIQGKLTRAQELAGSRREDVLAVGDVVVDPQRRQATAAGRSLRLTPTQFDILLALAHAGGRLLSCRDIVSQVYGHRMSEREARALLRPHLTALRRQLNPDPETPPRLINVRGAGYRLAEEPFAGTEQ